MLHKDSAATETANKRVFIVHGRDHSLRDELSQFLRNLGTEPIVLEEQPSGGRTLIEKFESYASTSDYAVVLLTPDDFGGLQSAFTPESRARQNVIFELGFFCAKLGRGHVCLLASPNLELPSDLSGIVYIPLDPHRQWSWQLLREFMGAGLHFPAEAVITACAPILKPRRTRPT